MSVTEFLLAGLGIKSFQRPLVFVSMGIATLFFGGIALAAIVLALIEIGQGEPVTLLGLAAVIVIPFTGLAYVSARMAKRCFEPN